MSYKIVHEFGEIFFGGEPDDSKWDLIEKPIAKVEYKLGVKTLILEGFEAYNHVVERFQIMGQKPGQNGICGLILMVKMANQVHKVMFNFRTSKVTQELVEFGKEYRGKPHSGWKKGIIGKKPTVKII